MHRFGEVDVRCWARPAILVRFLLAGLMLAAASSLAVANAELTPYATVGYAYQSNPLYQWSGTPIHVSPQSDSLLRLVGGADARLGWSRQTLTASAEVRRFEYDELQSLERTEDRFIGNYEWSPTEAVVAGASYDHEHRMVPFDQLAVVTQALMETENAAAASLRVPLPAAWQLVSRFGVRDLDSPRPGVPDLSLHESALRETLRRPGGALSAGLEAEYLNGSYHGAGALHARDYDQITVQLIGDRVISGFSKLSAALGYTKRDELDATGISTFTGFVSYERTFTGKTTGEVFVRRFVNSYISGATGEVDTTFGVRAAWQPTERLVAELSLVRSIADFPESVRSRQDHYQYSEIQLRYQATEYLSLSPYGRYAARSSTEPVFGFNATEIGIELVFREPR